MPKADIQMGLCKVDAWARRNGILPNEAKHRNLLIGRSPFQSQLVSSAMDQKTRIDSSLKPTVLMHEAAIEVNSTLAFIWSAFEWLTLEIFLLA